MANQPISQPAAAAPAPAAPVAPETVATPAETTAPSKQLIKLEGESVYSISFVESGIAYSKGKRKENDKKFTRYTKDGIAFSIPDEHPFNKDFANGQLKSVTLISELRDIERVDDNGDIVLIPTDTLQFSSYVNKQQWASLRDEELQDAKVDFAVSRYKKLKSEPVSADLLAALLSPSAEPVS